ETCHASSSNDNRAFVTCMEARGWYVKIPDRVEQETAGESWMTKLRKLDTTSTPTDSRDPSLTSNSPPATESTEISEEFDPLKALNISSWWKLGGSASALDRAISDCTAELGEQHRPTAGATQVTAGMLACLRSGGWHGLGVKATGSAPN
ncbi:MAG: hypothetical protein J4A00_08665, partial [Gammaproteobacteria bacterium]|nr:hypothetical protein [Gammaproteobacteria bacterium]